MWGCFLGGAVWVDVLFVVRFRGGFCRESLFSWVDQFGMFDGKRGDGFVLLR